MFYNALKHSGKVFLDQMALLIHNVYIHALCKITFSPKSWDNIIKAGISRNKLYRYFQVSYLKFCPDWVVNHRIYFTDKGFGEDAFHAYWLEVISTYRPSRLLEIGVYRGQIISLWSLISKELNITMEIVGISPFDNSGDSVSSYASMDYEKDIYKHFNYFNLPLPCLKKGLSKNYAEYIKNGEWDLIYIDGSHDYTDVHRDLEFAYTGLKKGGLAILDDSSLYTNFRPLLSKAFRGHSGPSQVFSELDNNKWKVILGVGHNNIILKI